MKKIVMIFIMSIALGITIYSVAFWEPYKQVDSKTQEGSNIVNVDEIKEEDENKNVKEEVINTAEVITEESASTIALNKTIYKIEKDQIKESISKGDLAKIESIVKKISTVDLGRIDLAKGNGEDGVKEIFNILKTRLSKKDYQIIESILEPYIDFSVFEKSV